MTSFEFKLQPLGPMVLAGMVAWLLEGPKSCRSFEISWPMHQDEVGAIGNLRIAPAMPIIPTELQGNAHHRDCAYIRWALEKGAAVLRPIREFNSPAFDAVVPKLYTAHQEGWRSTRRSQWQALLLEVSSPAAAE